MKQAKPKLWTRDFIILSFTGFFISLIFFLLMTSLTVYSIEELNASKSEAGLVSGIFTIGALLSRFVAGRYMEIVGRKKLLFGGLLLMLFPSLFYLVIHHLYLFMANRFIHGFGYGVAHTVLSTIVMDIIPAKRRGEGIGIFSLCYTLATAVGPFLGVFLLQNGSETIMFFTCILFTIISIVMSFFVKTPKVSMTKVQLDALGGFKLKDFFEIKAVPISILGGIIAFTYSGVLSFLTPYSMEISLTEAASFFFVVVAIFTVISRIYSGRLFDVKGENVVIYPCIIILTIGFAVLSQSHSGLILLVGAGLIGASYGTIQTCVQAIAIKESPPHRVALATSTPLIFINATMGIGPYLLGLLIPLTGYRGMYGILAAIVFASLFSYYFLHGKKKSIKVDLSHASKG